MINYVISSDYYCLFRDVKNSEYCALRIAARITVLLLRVVVQDALLIRSRPMSRPANPIILVVCCAQGVEPLRHIRRLEQSIICEILLTRQPWRLLKVRCGLSHRVAEGDRNAAFTREIPQTLTEGRQADSRITPERLSQLALLGIAGNYEEDLLVVRLLLGVACRQHLRQLGVSAKADALLDGIREVCLLQPKELLTQLN